MKRSDDYRIFVKSILFLIGLVIVEFDLHSQVNNGLDSISPKIEVSALYHNDAVYLRWAPNLPELWYTSLSGQYTIEKYEINPSDFSKKIIQTFKINPWTLRQFEPYLDTDNKYILAAGHVMYGEWESGINANQNIFGRNEEANNRYSIAMYIADIDSMASKALGLSFTDTEVVKEKQYFYILNFEKDSILIRGAISINTIQSELPELTFDDKSEAEGRVTLYWDNQKYEEIYSAFWVEKRSKNGRFEKVNKEPILPTSSLEFNSQIISFSDSIINYIPYEYRLIGITPFGIKSSPSATIFAMGRDKTPTQSPKNLRFEEASNSIKLQWDLVKDSDLSHYDIYRGLVYDGYFEKVNNTPIPKSQNFYYEKSELLKYSPYYFVSAVDTASNEAQSLKLKTFLRDTTPPLPPVGLKGSIDSNGVVKLSWYKNNENDLDGYMVYFSNQKEYFYTNLTGHVLKDTFYVDTITLKTLNEMIYYRIAAVDQHHHISEFSNILELKKPDVIPPQPPRITDIKIQDQLVVIYWNASKSADVLKQMILKRKMGSDWDTLSDHYSKQFIDSDVEEGKEYQYTTVSLDDDGLYSLIPKPVTIKVPKKINAFIPSNLIAYYDSLNNRIDLNWQGSSEDNKSYAIYRSINGGTFTLLETVDANLQTFTDYSNFQSGSTYAYKMRSNLNNGVRSPFSKIISINLQIKEK